MLAVWRKAALFDPSASGAATWIFTIARNLRIDAIRRESRGGAIHVDEVEAEYQVDDSPGADDRLAAAQSDARVREALSVLPSDQMKVIEMSFFEEKPHSEIAQTLRIPLGTVKSRVRLAMKRLRAVLELGTMTIEHHPEEAHTGGLRGRRLDLGQRVALATHLHACPRCRAWVSAMECVGGAVLAECPPAEMTADALDRALTRLDEPPPAACCPRRRDVRRAAGSCPPSCKRYAFGDWRFVAPRVAYASDPPAPIRAIPGSFF